MHTHESTPRVLIAFELSNKTWQTASTDGKRTRYKSLPAHDMEALTAEIKHLPGHFRVESPSFVSCYEAGCDGFSVHRMLDKLNVANLVVDSASIEVPRGHKQVKTDKVDAKKLLKLLQRHVGGEPNVFKVARVPEPEAEDARRLPREIERLKKERSAHVARIKSLLKIEGINIAKVADVDFSQLKSCIAEKLLPNLSSELCGEQARLQLVNEQLDTCEGRQRDNLARGTTRADEQAVKLQLPPRGLIQINAARCDCNPGFIYSRPRSVLEARRNY